MDRVERIAIERAKQLFGAEHANVQSHSGTQANISVYMTALEPGATVLGMNLAHGGHLTHGHPLNFSGKTYKFVAYGVTKDTETIDYDEIERLAREHQPKMIVAGASAYARIIDFARIAKIAQDAGALFFVDMAHIAGLVAAGIHPSPVPHADFVSTTTHKTLRGPRGGLVLCREKYAKDLDRITFPGVQGGPLEHIIAAKAVCLKEAAEPEFRVYQKQVVTNASVLAAALAKHGFRIVTGGTDNHLFLVDMHSRGITGRDAELALERAGMTVNKNAIPFDPLPPMKAGGIRVGTPAVTTRGMREPEMETDCGLDRGRAHSPGRFRHRATSARRSGHSRSEISTVCAALGRSGKRRRVARPPSKPLRRRVSIVSSVAYFSGPGGSDKRRNVSAKCICAVALQSSCPAR